MSRAIKKGSTDQSVVIRIIDSGDGTPEQAVEHNSSGISLWYRREGGSVTAITPAALAAANSAHSDGGIEHLDDGYYRLDSPDAAVASGANGVLFGGVVDGMVVIGCYVPLVDYDPQDTVRLGLTALPNAAADAAGGLPISDAGGFDVDNRAPSATSVGNMNVVFNTDFATNYDTTNDKWQVLARDHTTAALATATGVSAVETDTQDIQSRLPAALVNSRMDCTIDGTGMESGALNAIFNHDASSNTTNSTLGAIVNDWEDGGRLDLIVDATLADTNELQTDWVNGGRLDLILDATATATALASLVTTVGVAGAGLTEAGGDGDHLTAINLPNQTMDIVGNITGNLSGSVGSVTGAVGSVTGAVGSVTGAVGSVTGNVGGNVTGSVGSLVGHTVQTGDSYLLLTSAVPDSVPSDGTRPSPVQAIYMLIQAMTEGAISGTTWTIKKVDGSTTLFTVTLDDDTTPTSKTRSG